MMFFVATFAALVETPILTAPEASERVASGELVLLDIRTPEEWTETGLADGAWAVSMHTPDFPQQLQEILTRFSPDQIGLICATGGRSFYVTKVLAATMLLFTATASLADPGREAMQEYSEFATYDAGIIPPEQITEEIFTSVTFVDTRSQKEHLDGTVPGASHIEWRDTFARLEDPKRQQGHHFCNTGILSAQAAFGLRVLGHENVLVLPTGYLGWIENAAFRP